MESRQAAWRKLALTAAAVASAALLAGCGKTQDSSVIGTFRMGERVQAGPLIYNVLDSEWRTELGEAGRAPQNRFLFIRLSITNSGGQSVSLPAYELAAENGTKHQEITENVGGVRNWLGMLRTVRPATTEQGYIVFDVPVAAYKLMLTDGGDVATERHALVDIPVQLE